MEKKSSGTSVTRKKGEECMESSQNAGKKMPAAKRRMPKINRCRIWRKMPP